MDKRFNLEDIKQCKIVNAVGLMVLCDIYENVNLENINSLKVDKLNISIYIKSDKLSHFVQSVMPGINKPFKLVTGDSAITMPFEALTKAQTRELLNNPYLVKWYAQNLLFIHEKIDNWPLGLSFSLYREGRNYEVSAVSQEQYLQSIIKKMQPFYDRVNDPLKDPLIYVNMSMRNSRLESRWSCFNAIYLSDPSLCIDIDTILPKLETGTETPRDEVWIKTSEAPFCLSPFGYGIDSHRTYEILALGAIPIIRGHILDRLYTDMPVLYVEKWKEVTRSLLVKTLKDFSTRKFDYSRLKIKYWAELLN